MQETMGRRALLGAAGALASAGLIPSAFAQTPPVKLVGVSCSFRAGKNTASAVRVVLDAAKEALPGLEVELIDLAEKHIPGYVAAGLPLREGDADDFPEIIQKLEAPEVAGIVMGTPTYFGNMSSLCKAFLERCVSCRKNNFSLANKVLGVVATGGSRDGGQATAIASIQVAMMAQDMIVIGDGQPTPHTGTIFFAGDAGIEGDEIGMASAKNLGKHLAGVMTRLSAK